VLQMSAVVEGQLRAGVTALDLLRGLLPGGSITGAPKYRTRQIIDALEGRPRGVYTGAIGYLSADGAAGFNVAIRTMTHHRRTGEVRFGAGGAVVADSVAADEWDEVLTKAYPLHRALTLAEAHLRGAVRTPGVTF
ncbi:MAG: chorismate-binding protein, partial [Catalinimonas sp.]